MDRAARPTGLRRLAFGTSVLSFVLIALGGAVRATDSGLACPTWPGCFHAGDFIPPADLNVWLEHTHRLVAGVVGLLIAAMTVWVLIRFRRRRELLWPTLAAAVLVNVQALLGALVVWNLLQAELVTAHLGMAMIVLACLLWVTLALTVDARPMADVRATADPQAAAAEGRGFAQACAAVAALAFVQILVGGHVTGVGAGLAYTSFPLMDGAIVPPVGSERELFHVLHRFLAYALAGAVVWLWVRAARERAALGAAGAWTPAHRWLVTLPMLAAALVVVQIGLGVANLVWELSWLTVVPHLTVASWIWAVFIMQAFLAYRLAPAVGEPAGAVQVGDRGRRARQESHA